MRLRRTDEAGGQPKNQLDPELQPTRIGEWQRNTTMRTLGRGGSSLPGSGRPESLVSGRRKSLSSALFYMIRALARPRGAHLTLPWAEELSPDANLPCGPINSPQG